MAPMAAISQALSRFQLFPEEALRGSSRLARLAWLRFQAVSLSAANFPGYSGGLTIHSSRNRILAPLYFLPQLVLCRLPIRHARFGLIQALGLIRIIVQPVRRA